MGWIYTTNTRREMNIRKLIREHIPAIRDNRYQVIKEYVRDKVWYAALLEPQTGVIFAAVVPTDASETDFGYNFQTEETGPVQTGCPKAILDMLSDTDDERALKWRQKNLRMCFLRSTKRKVLRQYNRAEMLKEMKESGLTEVKFVISRLMEKSPDITQAESMPLVNEILNRRMLNHYN